MIHLLQCLCGTQRHAIYAILYDDQTITPVEAMEGFRALIEMQIDHRIINRRCEICDKGVVEFHFEDHITKEQEWDMAVAQVKLSEAKQALTRDLVQAARKAGKN